ncbi:MAG: DNA glycosylase [Methanosphaera sp.]|nr:DNA glycosylase [Methanosphaera sp.]
MIKNTFTIKYDEYKGDFDLTLTMNSGQTSQPPWTNVDGRYSEVLFVDGEYVLAEISQEFLNDDIIVSYYSNHEINNKSLRDKIFYIFDLDYDITGVYDFLEDNQELNDVYKFNRGLRLYKAQYPFESIISSICSANNSIKRWTKSVDDIKTSCGREFIFNNESHHIFPREEDFFEIPDDKLKSFGIGYRSSYMLNSTGRILSEDNFHEKIFEMSYEDSFKKIIELEGVGPKVADCILLYAYNKREAYPVDVWINRITTYLYFNGQKISNKKIMEFARESFDEYSGYIQLYLFNYARLSGLMDKIKSRH